MQIGPIAAAFSGYSAAVQRLNNSAHDIANLATEDPQQLRTVQVEDPSGGTRAMTLPDDRDGPVELAEESVEVIAARAQARASLRVLEVGARVESTLLDIVV